jgi:hypothetical protein
VEDVAIMKSRTPASPCPGCGETLDGATGANTDSAPTPGALSMCAYCAAVTIFGDDLRLRPLKPAEVAKIESEPETMALLMRASTAFHFLKASKN